MKNHRSILRAKNMEEKNMLETIVVVLFIVIVIGASILAWWFENGPERKEKLVDVAEGCEEERQE